MKAQRNEALPLGRQGRSETGSLALCQEVEVRNVVQLIALILIKRDKEGPRIIAIRSNSRRD